MLTVTKSLSIDAGHRLMKHEGRCRFVHGHRYTFTISAMAPDLDEVGRLIDFGVIKEVVGGWLDAHLDHGFIAQLGDPIIAWLRANDQKTFIMSAAPTAENLAALVFETARGQLASQLFPAIVCKVTCQETPTSAATCEA